MRHGSLFSGIGGFDLAAEWMGWENIFHCEWNEFGQRVLHHYWPNSITYADITKSDFTIHRGTIDILTGGFPCQPYSMAGKRLGKEDERHLWPEMLRAIREIQPTWVVGENVSGLINWNGGMVFDEVQADLEASGYDVIPFVLPACGVNAPHRRDRVWFVAHARLLGQEIGREQSMGFEQLCEKRYASPTQTTENTMRCGCTHGELNEEGAEIRQQRNACTRDTDGIRGAEVAGVVADTGCCKRENRLHGKQPGRQTAEFGNGDTELRPFDNFPTTKPTFRPGDDGIPERMAGMSFSKWRNESIKALGNAIVPQVVFQIFKAIEQYQQ